MSSNGARGCFPGENTFPVKWKTYVKWGGAFENAVTIDLSLWGESVAVAWAVPGGFMKVGLGLLHVAGGICSVNVASRWGCVQGVWEQCRCWSLGMGSRVSNVGRWDHRIRSCSSKLWSLPCCANWSREGRARVRARVRGTVWCVDSRLRGVLIGPLIAWNRTNKTIPYHTIKNVRR